MTQHHHDILDKTDRSMSPTFGDTRPAVPQRKKWNWSGASNRGEFMLVNKADLHIDSQYQREEVSKAKVLDIAKNWDWRLFGTILVVMRNDGSLWVYDGGHRARAAHYRDDIIDLPCMVFEAPEVSDEAKAFVGTNTVKSNVSAFHVFRASVVAGEPLAIATKEMIERHGYHASPDKAQFGIQAIATVLSLMRENPVLAENVFHALTSIAVDGEQISAAVMHGLFVLANRLSPYEDILSGELLAKLKREGIAGMEAAIRREKHLAGIGGALISAKAILALLNKGKRNKLTWGMA